MVWLVPAKPSLVVVSTGSSHVDRHYRCQSSQTFKAVGNVNRGVSDISYDKVCNSEIVDLQRLWLVSEGPFLFVC